MTQSNALPVRFTVCTYNIWTDTRWPQRRAALMRFADLHRPDILCLQEVQPESLAALDDVLLPTHQRITDPFAGWAHEGNLYWNSRLFTLVEHGAEDIGILEPLRRLFWARLSVNDGSGRTLLVSTAHYTYDGHPKAVESEQYVRLPMARATLAFLNGAQREGEPQLFMGDLNDAYRGMGLLMAGGLTPSFYALGRLARFTHPAEPTAGGNPVAIDWLMHRGPLQVMTSEVVDFYHEDLAPSDHKAVLATYSLA